MVARRLALALAATALLSACSGSAGAATRTYGLTGYDKLRVDGPFTVRVHVGGAPGARATGPQAAIDRLSVEQHDDTLVIKPLPGGWGGWPGADQGKLVIEVGAPSLSLAALSGSGDLAIDRIRGDGVRLTLAGSGNLTVGALDVADLGAVVTGSGGLTLSGRARKATATVTGSGDLHGDKLAADEATVNLIGSGDLAIAAQHVAKVTLTGSGDVTIAGPATCAITRSGSGEVTCAHRSGD